MPSWIYLEKKTRCRLEAFNEVLQAVRRHCPINEMDVEDVADFQFQENDETLLIYKRYGVMDADYDSDESIDVDEPCIK